MSIDANEYVVIEYDKECKLTGTVNVPADVNYFIIRQTPNFKVQPIVKFSNFGGFFQKEHKI